MAAGLLDDGTDPAYWPVLEYDPTALDPDSAETPHALDPQLWPLPDASLTAPAIPQPMVSIPPTSTSPGLPQGPSTPDGLRDHRAADTAEPVPSAEDTGPRELDEVDVQGGFGGVLPDPASLQPHRTGGDAAATAVIEEGSAEGDAIPNGWAREGQGDGLAPADADEAASHEGASAGNGDLKENGHSAKKAKSRKKKKVGSFPIECSELHEVVVAMMCTIPAPSQLIGASVFAAVQLSKLCSQCMQCAPPPPPPWLAASPEP